MKLTLYFFLPSDCISLPRPGPPVSLLATDLVLSPPPGAWFPDATRLDIPIPNTPPRPPSVLICPAASTTPGGAAASLGDARTPASTDPAPPRRPWPRRSAPSPVRRQRFPIETNPSHAHCLLPSPCPPRISSATLARFVSLPLSLFLSLPPLSVAACASVSHPNVSEKPTDLFWSAFPLRGACVPHVVEFSIVPGFPCAPVCANWLVIHLISVDREIYCLLQRERNVSALVMLRHRQSIPGDISICFTAVAEFTQCSRLWAFWPRALLLHCFWFVPHQGKWYVLPIFYHFILIVCICQLIDHGTHATCLSNSTGDVLPHD